jgi:alpha-L-arabinofuranosidase
MQASVRLTGGILGTAGEQLLSNNIEAYENTIPCMVSDRLRNPKFAGPENPQTGVAAEWEPAGNGMECLACRLVPGMYLSGRESQLIHNYGEHGDRGILQPGVTVRAGEEFDVELWVRVQHRPVEVAVELALPGCRPPEGCRAVLSCAHAHWHRIQCRLASPGDGKAYFRILIPGDSRLVIDQVHLRPVGEPHVSRALLDAFEQFPCPVLRFPGGCESCTYHWEHGVGPVHLRPVVDDPVFKYKVHYDFGTDEYLELCAARGIRPMITLNTSTATPEDAAAWASYVRAWYVARELPVPPAYFIFGNENYGAWEIGHMTGEMYVEQLRVFVPGVRAAYPEARIMAIGEFDAGGVRDAYKTYWRSVVLEKGAGLFDGLVVTSYAWGTDDLDAADTMAAVANCVSGKEGNLRLQAQTIRDAGLDCTMGIVEWNYWTRASHNDHAGFFEPNDIRHCLYAAGYINAFCRMGEILEVANYYSLVNTMGMIHVHDGRVAFSDVVKVFNLYADVLPGTVLELEVDAPALTEHSRVLDANVVEHDGTRYVFLTNYSATDSVDVSLSGMGAIQDTRGLRAEAILKPVDAFVPDAGADRVTMPPMSMVRVVCRGADATA